VPGIVVFAAEAERADAVAFGAEFCTGLGEAAHEAWVVAQRIRGLAVE